MTFEVSRPGRALHRTTVEAVAAALDLSDGREYRRWLEFAALRQTGRSHHPWVPRLAAPGH